MKYFIGVLVILFFVIVGVLLFTGRDEAPDVLTNQDTELSQYADGPDSQVTWIKRGEIVAPEEHYAVRVTISASSRTVEVLQGYDEQLISRETFRNTEESYRVFLAALDNLGFERVKDGNYDDITGVCPTGFRYEYRLVSGVETVVDTWSTSCSRRDGTFDGSASTVRRLFQEQIPEYNDLTEAAKF